MAAQQQQVERIVDVRDGLRLGRGEGGGVVLSAAAGRLIPPQLCPPPRRNGDEPAFGIAWYAFGRPLQRRRQQRLLDCVFAGVDAAEVTYERTEDLRCQVAQ